MVTDYKEVLQMPDVDAVIICASWDMHVEMCIEAMNMLQDRKSVV